MSMGVSKAPVEVIFLCEFFLDVVVYVGSFLRLPDPLLYCVGSTVFSIMLELRAMPMLVRRILSFSASYLTFFEDIFSMALL